MLHRPPAAVIGLGLALGLAAGAAAQVPAELKPKIVVIGRVVNPTATRPLYEGLHARPPYPGVAVVRDVAYGPSPRNLLDLFTPTDAATAPRPVLIFVPGGAGNKSEYGPFYDNVMLWAVKNGFVGVNMMRDSGAGTAWDQGGRNIAAVVEWVRANIAAKGGDPGRVYIWGHSAGAGALSVYLGQPGLWSVHGVGVKAAVLQSGGGVNLAPLVLRTPQGPPPVPAPGAPPAVPAPPLDPGVQLQRSVLGGLRALTIPLFITAAEYDPERTVEVQEVLRQQLVSAGRNPGYLIMKDHGHMSVVYAVNTADVSVSDPILAWLRAVR